MTPGRYVGVAEVVPGLPQVGEQVGEQVSSIMTKEQKFYKALQDVFIGAKIEGTE